MWYKHNTTPSITNVFCLHMLHLGAKNWEWQNWKMTRWEFDILKIWPFPKVWFKEFSAKGIFCRKYKVKKILVEKDLVERNICSKWKFGRINFIKLIFKPPIHMTSQKYKRMKNQEHSEHKKFLKIVFKWMYEFSWTNILWASFF